MPIEKIDSSFYVSQVFGMVAGRRGCQSYNIFLGIKPSIGWLQGALPDRYIKNVVMVGYNYRRAQAFYYFLGMGKAYYMMGIDIDFYTPIFVMSRITGWSAHIMEQHASNKLIRPLSKYRGAEVREVMLLNQR